MAKIIELPKLSPTMEEGTLVRWVKREGEPVGIDDLLAEVETDKATMEFRSFDKGTLLKQLVAEGAVVKLGQPVAIFGKPGEDIAALVAKAGGGEGGGARVSAPPEEPAKPASEAPPQAPRETPPPAAPSEAPAAHVASQRPTIPITSTSAPGPAVAAWRGEPGVAGAILAPSTPRVRRIARERDVNLGAVQGSGAHGRITEEDLAAPKAARAPEGEKRASDATASVMRVGDSVRAASPTRKTIARRLVEAKQTVPHFYLEADLDVEALAALRETLNEGASPEDKISFNDLIVRASALALRVVPEANASWIDGQIVQYDRADISIAVAIDDGLVTPVLREADRLSIRVIARAAKDLAARARARKLKLEEMQGGVFSVSNLGMFKIDRFAAVINPPESMILAVGAVRDVPVVKGGQVAPGKRCAVTLSCDHRVVDGALGAKFLLALREIIEKPLRVIV